MLEVALHCYEPIRARYLELQVVVVGDGHELGVAWAPPEWHGMSP